MPAFQLPVTVRNCIKGEVPMTPDTCIKCSAATYSFSPNASACEARCPDNADCQGGAVLVPELGYWHSAADSTYMAACPNSKACQGDRSVLATCQNMTYASPDIQGHTMVCYQSAVERNFENSALGNQQYWLLRHDLVSNPGMHLL